MAYQGMATLVYCGCQLNGIREFQAMTQAEAGSENGNVSIEGAKAPAGCIRESAPIALRQGFLASSQRPRNDLGQRDGRDERGNPAGFHIGEDRLEPGREWMAIEHVDWRQTGKNAEF